MIIGFSHVKLKTPSLESIDFDSDLDLEDSTEVNVLKIYS